MLRTTYSGSSYTACRYGRPAREERAGEDHAGPRPPAPRGIAGLSAPMNEIERDLTRRDRERVVVDRVGIVVLARPGRRDRELSRIDLRIPLRRRRVPIEPQGNRPVPDDTRPRPILLTRFVKERRHPTRMIRVPVRVDRG